MTCETPTIRPLRRTDFPALEELIRLAWYDDGNDSHNTHDEVGQTSGPDKHRAELRKATRLRNMHRLAAIDMQDCLARTTKAYVAELNGQVLGVILGSLRSDITGRQRTRHMLRRHCLTLPLLASHEGRHGLLAQLAILQADEALKHDAGKEYEAEVVLFVVSPAARGMGVGRRLFNHMLGVFHDAGLREYFLFTDSTCDVGFYDHRGLIRKAERDDRNDGSSRPNPTDSSSSGLTVGTTSLLADDEPMSYFLYVGRC